MFIYVHPACFTHFMRDCHTPQDHCYEYPWHIIMVFHKSNAYRSGMAPICQKPTIEVKSSCDPAEFSGTFSNLSI